MIQLLKKCNYLIIIIVFQVVTTNVFAKVIILKNLTVTKVIDGDTIWVKDIKNNSFKIRFVGINATEISTSPPQPFSVEAQKEVNDLLNNKLIYAKYDTENKKDKYNRLLAQVYRQEDNFWINAYLVSKGLAYVYIISNNIIDLSKLIELENKAIKLCINLWGNNSYRPIKATESILFKGKYKVIMGTVEKINTTKKNIWIEITENTKKTFKPIDKESIKYLLSIKISKKLFENKYDWEQLLYKQIKIRGYIEQYKPNLLPFVKLINLQNIEILNHN